VNVYCAASVRGEPGYKKFSDLIPSIVAASGNTPLSELTLIKAGNFNDDEIFTRDIKWLEDSRCLIAEVSSGSTGVGFEIAYALYSIKIPVLALYYYDSKTVSAMVKGCTSPLLYIESYNDADELQIKISGFLSHLRRRSDR
jgi:hypothetical protein